MNLKNISKYVAIICAVAVMFTACESDENVVETEPLKGEVAINANQSFKVLKFSISSFDSVYVAQGDGTFIVHKTIKIRNLQWTMVQEWLYEDLKTTGIEPHTANSSGYYYPWSQIKFEDDQNIWDYIICENENWIPMSGNKFHLPKFDSYLGANDGDITKLASVLGSKSLVRSKLNIAYDGVQYANPEYSPNEADIWVDAHGTYQQANLNGGWGALGEWRTDNSFWHVFPNFGVRANVRLVRNITISEW